MAYAILVSIASATAPESNSDDGAAGDDRHRWRDVSFAVGSGFWGLQAGSNNRVHMRESHSKGPWIDVRRRSWKLCAGHILHLCSAM